MNILVIGCGGIGSYFLRELSQLVLNNVDGTKRVAVKVVDGDEVEEKNLRYQNFEIEDLAKPKAEVISERYAFDYDVKYIENNDALNNFDIIVLAVDNGKVRDLVYKYCLSNNTHFIDMRSEGRAYAVYTKHKENTLEVLQKTYDVEKPSTSCQLKFELDKGTIQVGNRIVAMIGIQMLLNFLRGEKNVAQLKGRI